MFLVNNGENATLGRCFPYSGWKDKNGYGVIRAWRKFRIKERRAHRAAWIIANGPIPKGVFVLHKCDNPSCIRISHLFLGTALDNKRDSQHKNRGVIGERNGRAILTWSQVKQIRSLYHGKWREQTQLAKRFGVSPTTIRLIV